MEPIKYSIGFRINHSLLKPDTDTKVKPISIVELIDDILSKYSHKITGYCLGEDSTYMEAEEPHYHLHMITDHLDDAGKPITKRSLEHIREGRWKYGQALHMKISEWDGDMRFLAYAGKEKLIRHNLPLGIITDLAFKSLCDECLETKKTKHAKYSKERNIIKLKKDLKAHLLTYIEANMDAVKTKLHAYQALQCYSSSHGSPQYLEEAALVKICLEKYQMEFNKHFRQFEIDRYVCEYFRGRMDYLEMYFLRHSGQKVF